MAAAFTVGVTGSLGSGKTELCRLLAARGFAVVDADQISRDVAVPGSPVLAELAAAFGADIIDERGGLDRDLLARRAFVDHRQRDRLEAIVHPPIRRAIQQAVDELAAAGHRIVVVEAAMILESGRRAFYDMLVVVTAADQRKIERAVKRGLPAAEASRRLALQWSDERKTAEADWVVENDGELAALAGQADLLAAELRRRALTGAAGSPAADRAGGSPPARHDVEERTGDEG
jgi:dephospho-CoA kinase